MARLNCLASGHVNSIHMAAPRSSAEHSLLHPVTLHPPGIANPVAQQASRV